MIQQAEHARIAERARKAIEASERDHTLIGKMLALKNAATLALLAYETLAGQVRQGENDV